MDQVRIEVYQPKYNYLLKAYEKIGATLSFRFRIRYTFIEKTTKAITIPFRSSTTWKNSIATIKGRSASGANVLNLLTSSRIPKLISIRAIPKIIKLPPLLNATELRRTNQDVILRIDQLLISTMPNSPFVAVNPLIVI